MTTMAVFTFPLWYLSQLYLIIWLIISSVPSTHTEGQGFLGLVYPSTPQVTSTVPGKQIPTGIIILFFKL